MSNDNEQPQLPAETKPVFELAVSTTNVTKEAIAQLKKETNELPEEDNDDNLVIWKRHRKDLKELRGNAKEYVIKLKQDIKKLGGKVVTDWESLEKELLNLESKSDKLIKEHEKIIKEKREAKKKEKEEKAAAIKKIDDEIQALGNVPVKFIKSSSTAIRKEITRLEELELTETEFSDRVEEAELKRELSVENLQELFDAAVDKEKAQAELKKSQEELAEQKRKDKERADAEVKKVEEETAEAFRVDNIKDMIKSFDSFIIESANLTTSEELKAKINYLESFPVTDAIYFEFVKEASDKKQSVLKTICALMDSKVLIERAAETALAQKDKMAQDTKDLEEREEKLRLDQKQLDDDKISAEETESATDEEPPELEDDVVEEGSIPQSKNPTTPPLPPKKPYDDHTDAEKIEALKEWVFNSPKEFPNRAYFLIEDVCEIAEKSIQ